MSLLQIRQIQRSVILAKTAQKLRQVSCLQPCLMRVRQGEKHIWQGETLAIARRGDMLIAPAGLEMTLINHPDAHGYACEVLIFDPQLIQHFRATHPEITQTLLQAEPQLCITPNSVIAKLWDEVYTELESHEPNELLHHRAAGLLLALAMAGHGAALLIDRGDSLIRRVQCVLLLQASKEWTVDEVAQQLHMGASTLRRQLANEGSSFRQLLKQVRLNLALGMIQTTQQPIGQIAQQCGYASASRFSARFTQQFGMKPLQLRATVT